MKNIPAHSTFSQVLKEAQSRVDSFSEAKSKRLKDTLDHGLGNLKTQDEMDMYLVSYGEIHRAKHMEEFGDMLHPFTLIYSFEKHIDDWDKPFSCQIRLFANCWY